MPTFALRGQPIETPGRVIRRRQQCCIAPKRRVRIGEQRRAGRSKAWSVKHGNCCLPQCLGPRQRRIRGLPAEQFGGQQVGGGGMHRSVSHKQRARARVEECASEPRRRLNARAVAGPGVARADTRDVRSDTQNILDTLRRSQQGTGHLGTSSARYRRCRWRRPFDDGGNPHARARRRLGGNCPRVIPSVPRKPPLQAARFSVLAGGRDQE